MSHTTGVACVIFCVYFVFTIQNQNAYLGTSYEFAGAGMRPRGGV
jgi:hypothetical protein